MELMLKWDFLTFSLNVSPPKSTSSQEQEWLMPAQLQVGGRGKERQGRGIGIFTSNTLCNENDKKVITQDSVAGMTLPWIHTHTESSDLG